MGRSRIRVGYVVSVFFLLVAVLTSDVLSLALAAGIAAATAGAEWYVARRSAPPDPDDLGEVMVAWARGWALARRGRMTELDGAVRVDLATSMEYVVGDAPDVLEPAIDTVRATPGARLDVVTKDPDAVRVWLADSGLAVERTESFWHVSLVDHGGRDLPDGFEAAVSRAGGAIYVTLTDEGGEQAATGRISVFSSDAVADRVSTEPEHRRHGLGAAVLGRLVAEARDAGATRGLAVVPAEGEPLFEALGWERIGAVVVASGPRTS